MSKNLMIWIACVVAADLVVTTIFVRRFLAKRRVKAGAAGAPAAIGGSGLQIPSMVALRRFSDAIHPRIGEILRSSWSGDPDALPSVLTMALDETEREARNQGLTLDRDLLKKVVELSVAKHHLAKGAVLREALVKVA